MINVKLKSDLTSDEIALAAEELSKLSSFKKVEAKMEAEGRPITPLPESMLPGSRARDNKVFVKDYVQGAFELAQMLNIEDKGTVNPSKGLSFKASNYKYYDFMEFWTALIHRFNTNEVEHNRLRDDMITAQEDVATVEEDTALLTDNFSSLETNFKILYNYVDKAIQNIKLEQKDQETTLNHFRQATELFAGGIHVMRDRVEVQDREIAKLKKANTNLKKVFWRISTILIASSIVTYLLLYFK